MACIISAADDKELINEATRQKLVKMRNAHVPETAVFVEESSWSIRMGTDCCEPSAHGGRMTVANYKR